MGLDSLVREPKLWLVLHPLNGHMSDQAENALFSELIVLNLPPSPTHPWGKEANTKIT